MKCSLGVSNFLEESSNLSHFIVFLYLFALVTEGSNKSFCTWGTRTPQRLSQTCLWVLECLLQRYGSSLACHRGRDSGCVACGLGALSVVLTSLLCSSHKFKNLLWAHMQEYSVSEHINQRKHYNRLSLWTHSSPIDLQLINPAVRAKCIKPRAQHSNINREWVGGIQGSSILIPTHLWTRLSQWIICRTHSHSPSSSTSIAALTKGGNEHCFNGCSCCSESTRTASVHGGGARCQLWLWYGKVLDFLWARTRWPA